MEWDPKKRGRNADGEIIVFSEIEYLLSKKVRGVDLHFITFKGLVL